MFNKNTYMIPHQGTSPTTSVLDLNGNEILLHHDMFSGHYLAAANVPPVEAAAALFNQDINGGGGLSGEHSGTLNTCPRTPKRDRHSKIDTAQGPRDRRVRLSIGVARKFFDLQEMLGFDKPSKTLDWLLTKSKTAIKDLVHTTKQSSAGVLVSSPPPTSDECEVENDENALYEKGKSVIKNTASVTTKGAAVKDLLAKESRVKARARARERTREKMCIKQLNESRNAGYCDLIIPSNNNNNSNIPIQYMNNQLDQFCRISGSNNGRLLSGMNYPTNNYGECDNQESVNVIKRKVKNHPSMLGFHQPNLVLSGSNYGFPFSGNYNNATDQNWDHISGFSPSHSNLSAILDQHKFNNR